MQNMDGKKVLQNISRVFGRNLSQRFRKHRARARARTCLGDAATNDARRASGGYIARACLAPESREGGLQRTSRYAEKHARAFFSRVCAACASRDTHTRNANKPVSRARVCFLHRATDRSAASRMLVRRDNAQSREGGLLREGVVARAVANTGGSTSPVAQEW